MLLPNKTFVSRVGLFRKLKNVIPVWRYCCPPPVSEHTSTYLDSFMHTHMDKISFLSFPVQMMEQSIGAVDSHLFIV